MEFFHEVNIDWMGKSKYFITLSLVLLAVGWISVWRNHGLRYGIDFRGGTLVVVRFANTPPVDQIRKGLNSVGLPNSTITPITDISDPNSKNDVQISLEENAKGVSGGDADRQAVLAALHKMFSSTSTKPDFNTVSPDDLAVVLTQANPLSLGVNAADRYKQLAQALTGGRDRLGIVTNFDQLKSVDGATPAVLSTLSSSYQLGDFAIRDVESVGPRVGAQLRNQALYATLYALGGMLLYIALRFGSGGADFVTLLIGMVGVCAFLVGIVLLGVALLRGKWSLIAFALLAFAVCWLTRNLVPVWIDYAIFGLAAVIAVFHDVLITLGFFSLRHYEISLTVIAALLTLVGYSMNDTIVIFDRVREDLRIMRRESFPDIVNKAINQTLSRTILTSGLTLLTVLVLYLLGGEVLRAFSFAMVAGVVVGTYSSFGIAAPIVVFWNKHYGQGTAVRAGSAADKRAPAVGR
ncbi:MAG TPA: protein translocase subunit SecF [Candidatus Acidoferrales bacterium]|nr:protein translocase subunit SecF [Candidatus Acidoferrales bacterium]